MGSPLCCGLSLKKGSLIVGSAEFVGYFISFAISIWAWWSLADDHSEEAQTHRNQLEERANASRNNLEPDLDDEALTKSLLALTFSAVLCAIGIVSAIVLLVGVNQKSTNTLRTWLIVKAILVGLLIVHSVLSFEPLSASFEGLAAFIINAIFLICSLYFMIVICAYWRKLLGYQRGSKYAKNSPEETRETKIEVELEKVRGA